MYRFSEAINNVSGTATREILKLTQGGDIVSFAGGLPASECLPAAEIAAIVDGLFRSGNTDRLLQYGISEGMPGLRAAFLPFLSNGGVDVNSDEIAVVSGGQQGLELTVKAFINPGDTVLVEDPTYLAFLQIVKSYRGVPVGVNAADDGLDLADLEAKIKAHRPKLLYVVPTFSNPTGRTYSSFNRQGILELCERYDVMIVEDEPYARLRFAGNPVKPLKALDKSGRVVYIVSLSKVFSPGLRVAAAVAAPEVIKKLVLGKQNGDLATASLSQAAAEVYLKTGALEQNLAKSIPVYRRRSQAMTAALDRYMPDGFTRTDPEGGLFIWCELPPVLDAQALFKTAVEHKVAFVPGHVFFAGGGHQNTLRLNFTGAKEADIEPGIERLARVIRDAL